MVNANRKKRLIIDSQVFQTPSWHRGMGKYSMALLAGISKLEDFKNFEVSLLFNGKLDIPEEILTELSKIFGENSLLKIDLEVPRVPRTDYSIKSVAMKNKEILSSEIKKSFGEDEISFLILALYLDEVCPVFPNKDTSSNNMVIYYDSIPLLYHQRYGQFKGFFKNFYLPHTATVFEADKIFTISKTVANDLHLMLGIKKEKIINIDGASIPRQEVKSTAPKNFTRAPFILMASGQELRKNNHRAIQAFEQFRQKNDKDLCLVVTSTFTEEARDELGKLSENVLFTGNVTEGELSWIYKNARFVYFATEYEGLGLPVLEAVEEGKVIACSEISVFKEMSKTGFNYFDPLNIDSIAEGLEKANRRALDNVIDAAEYKKIIKKYTWEHTAREVLSAANKNNLKHDITKLKVAIFCPDPEGFSAIGKVVAESHADYSEFFDIDYYFDRGPNHKYIRPNVLPHLENCYEAEDFTAADYDKYDAVIYHIGNSEYHLNIIRTTLSFPGFAIFHDTNLGGAYDSLLGEGFITNQRYNLETELDELCGSGKTKTHSSYLVSIASSQKGLVTHSKYAQNAIKNKLLKDVQIRKANLPVSTPIYPDIAKNDSGKLNISLAGIIAKVKGTDIIEEIALSKEFASCNINIFGYSAVEPEQLDKLRKLSHVQLTTNPTDFEFQKLMAATDILINVRLVYRGETSLTTLEQMRYGGVVIVRNFGWYSELPESSVVSVDDPSEVVRVLKQLISDRKKIAKLKTESLKYIKDSHTHHQYAKAMYELIVQNK